MTDQYTHDAFFYTVALLIVRSIKVEKFVNHDTALPRSCQVFAKPQIWARTGAGPTTVVAYRTEPIIG
jgi:hypothetical protein